MSVWTNCRMCGTGIDMENREAPMCDDCQDRPNTAYHEAIDIIKELIAQSCEERRVGGKVAYHSGFISAYAEALRFLVDEGKAELVHDGGGRCVEAKIWV